MSDEAICALNAECDAMQDEIERLTAENAKLRKLVCRLDEAIALAYMMHVPPTTADVLIAHEDEVDDG